MAPKQAVRGRGAVAREREQEQAVRGVDRAARGAVARERGWRGARGVWALASLLVLGAVTAGCGIRTTSVPVDAGAAPSRLPCTLSGQDASEAPAPTTSAGPAVPVRVYLVCASALEAVERAVPSPSGRPAGEARSATARALLNQLLARPSEQEREAGFASHVEPPLAVSAGRPGDPAEVLRLSRQPEDLPATALSQLVCTYAENGVEAGDGTVVLGGPGDYPVRRYVCPAGQKERPESPVPTRSPAPGSGTGPGAPGSPPGPAGTGSPEAGGKEPDATESP
ncbi:hypothetical protein [Streptomyces sp. NPDC046887]|uniref:hypothetical protein n=1 Tax=Streptomyces sp. NPDC046887 TaxID=3155472 RepID=UPI0033F84B7F